MFDGTSLLAAWFCSASNAARAAFTGLFSLRRLYHASGGIGTFEAVETLVLGIREKLSLWHVLRIACKVDPRIPSLDFEKLKRGGVRRSRGKTTLAISCYHVPSPTVACKYGNIFSISDSHPRG